MIRSGLVNQRRGGGFEEGFPHQRDARNTYDIRPYVDSIDTGFKKPSDFSIIIPKTVSYAQIFSKKLTPGEKVFLARQVKRGIRKAQRIRKVYTGVDDKFEESIPLTDTPEIETPEEPAPKEPTLERQLSGVEESGYDKTWEEEYALRNELFNEELEAADIVYPMIHHETFDEQEEADMMWESGKMGDVVDNDNHSKDDIAITTENNFGGNVKLSNPQRVSKSRVSKKTKDTNGVGPRMRI